MPWPERTLACILLAVACGCARPAGQRYLTPSRGEWTRAGPIRRFTADNLYDYIDGEAPFVVSFGFRSLAQATYRRGGADTIVDIYDMGCADNAFALFRSHSNVEAEPLDVGSEGASDEARVDFWQGRYYVAVGLPSPAERPSALALARGLARDLPPTAAWPAYLALLPTDGRVARSEQYAPSDFLGRQFLKNAVFARYRLGDAEATLFACRCDSPTEAAVVLERLEFAYRKKHPVRPLAVGEGGFAADEPTLGRIAAFRRGSFVAGATRCPESPAADRLLADLDQRLAKAAAAPSH